MTRKQKKAAFKVAKELKEFFFSNIREENSVVKGPFSYEPGGWVTPEYWGGARAYYTLPGGNLILHYEDRCWKHPARWVVVDHSRTGWPVDVLVFTEDRL